MFGFTKKLAGWAAGRLKGEKARQKTMDWMEKTGVGKVLGGLGDAALLGGAGKLVGAGAQAMGLGRAAQAGTGAATGLKAMPEMGQAITSVGGQAPGAVAGLSSAGTSSALNAMPAMGRGITSIGERVASSVAAPAASAALTPTVTPGLLSRAGTSALNMAKGAGSYLATKPEVAAMGLTAMSQAQQNAANRAIQAQQLAQQQEQFNRTFGQSEEERKREIERQQRIAQMLAPLFQRISGGQG